MGDDRRLFLAGALGFGGGVLATNELGARTQIISPDFPKDAGRNPYVYDVQHWLVGDGKTNCDEGLQRLNAAVRQRSAAGNTLMVRWPAGRYVFSVMPNWAIPMLHMAFEGEVWLVNIGSGDGLIFDGGIAGPGVFGVTVSGFPRIYGYESSRHGVFARAIHRSRLDVCCQGAGAEFAGFHGEWLVSNQIRFSMNANEGGIYNKPLTGMTLTSRANRRQEQSSYNSLIEVELSGLPTGLYLNHSLGNKLFGGAIQGNESGIRLSHHAWANKLIGVDFESNKYDLIDDGRSTQLYACDFESGPIFSSKSRRATMVGGETRSIEIREGAELTILSGVRYNRFQNNGSIIDNGRDTKTRDLIDESPESQLAQGDISVRSNPFIFKNTSYNACYITVYGEGDREIAITSGGKSMTMPKDGQYILGPGDEINIRYKKIPPSVRVHAL